MINMVTFIILLTVLMVGAKQVPESEPIVENIDLKLTEKVSEQTSVSIENELLSEKSLSIDEKHDEDEDLTTAESKGAAAEEVTAEKRATEEVTEEVVAEEVAAKEVAVEEVVADKVATEEAAIEEVVAEEVVAEEVVTEEVVTEEVAKEDVAKEEIAKEEVPVEAIEEVAIEEVAAEEVTQEEVAKEEVAKEEVAIEEVATEEAAIEEPVTEEAATEEAAIEEVVTEEVATEEAEIEEAVTEEAATEEAAIEEVATEEAAIEEAVTEEAATEEVAAKEVTVEVAVEEVAVEEVAVEEVAADEEVAEKVATEEVVSEEVPAEEEEVATEEISIEEVAIEEVAAEVVVTDEEAKEDVAKEDVVKEEIAKEAVAVEEVAVEEVATEEVAAKKVVDEDVVAEEVEVATGEVAIEEVTQEEVAAEEENIEIKTQQSDEAIFVEMQSELEKKEASQEIINTESQAYSKDELIQPTYMIVDRLSAATSAIKIMIVNYFPAADKLQLVDVVSPVFGSVLLLAAFCDIDKYLLIGLSSYFIGLGFILKPQVFLEIIFNASLDNLDPMHISLLCMCGVGYIMVATFFYYAWVSPRKSTKAFILLALMIKNICIVGVTTMHLSADQFMTDFFTGHAFIHCCAALTEFVHVSRLAHLADFKGDFTVRGLSLHIFLDMLCNAVFFIASISDPHFFPIVQEGQIDAMHLYLGNIHAMFILANISLAALSLTFSEESDRSAYLVPRAIQQVGLLAISLYNYAALPAAVVQGCVILNILLGLRSIKKAKED